MARNNVRNIVSSLTRFGGRQNYNSDTQEVKGIIDNSPTCLSLEGFSSDQLLRAAEEIKVTFEQNGPTLQLANHLRGLEARISETDEDPFI